MLNNKTRKIAIIALHNFLKGCISERRNVTSLLTSFNIKNLENIKKLRNFANENQPQLLTNKHY